MEVALPDPARCIFLDVEYTSWKKTMVIGFFHIAYGYRRLYKRHWRSRIRSDWVRRWFEFLTDSKGADTLVTYSGRDFDLGAIRREPGVDLIEEFGLEHFDLYEAAEILASAGIIRKKGLKMLEKHFKIFRPTLYGSKRMSIHWLFEIVEGSRHDADLSSKEALERLITYNYFDTANLYFLLCRMRDKYGPILDTDIISER